MTPISNFYEPIRVLIGDSDPDIQLREDAQIAAAIRLVLNLGRVVGDQAIVAAYAVANTNTDVTPDLTPAADPKAFAQLIYYAARQFAVDISPTLWRTRAFTESVGENRERVWALLEDIMKLEFGGFLDSSNYT